MDIRPIYPTHFKHLECPVCVEYMTYSINICQNGHSICGSCRERLTKCPTCRGNFCNVRNIALEKIASCVRYPCKNAKDGCKEMFTGNDRDSHLAVCLFQSIECPFRKLSGVDCPWTGTVSDIGVHILHGHHSDTVEVPAHFGVKLPHFGLGNLYRRVVVCFGEIFYLAWDTQRFICRFGVFHFGTKDVTNNFKYGIKFGNADAYVAASHKCHNYLEGGLNDIQASNCVTLNFDGIPKPAGENEEYLCEIELGKLKLRGFVSEYMPEYIPVFPAIWNSDFASITRVNRGLSATRNELPSGRDMMRQHRSNQLSYWRERLNH